MNSESPVLLFSYGTLQDRAVQLATFGRELCGRPDALTGFTQTLVEITDPEVLAASGKTHHPIGKPTSLREDTVPDTVFEITQAELLAADDYEVDDYIRVEVILQSGAEAGVYIQV